jgi:hypothetical protein
VWKKQARFEVKMKEYEDNKYANEKRLYAEAEARKHNNSPK